MGKCILLKENKKKKHQENVIPKQNILKILKSNHDSFTKQLIYNNLAIGHSEETHIKKTNLCLHTCISGNPPSSLINSK